MNVFAKTLAALALSVVGGVVLLIAGSFFFDFYKRKPIDAFCNDVSVGAAAQEIVALAEAKGLWVNPRDDNQDAVWVFNQRAPWGRYACILDLQKGRVSAKRVMAAD